MVTSTIRPSVSNLSSQRASEGELMRSWSPSSSPSRFSPCFSQEPAIEGRVEAWRQRKYVG